MNTDAIKVLVEYTIITTSDWTQFEIIDGGWWENLHVDCKLGADKLKQAIVAGKTLIRIDKQAEDETPVVAYVKGHLNIEKDYWESNIQYKITKGNIQSTIILCSTNRRKLPPIVNKRSDDYWDGKNPIIASSEAKNYLPDWSKDKVFIIHGQDRIQPLLLYKFLKNHGVNAIIFDDLSDNGKTIMEQIEYIRNNVSFAFAILTPDDVGCLKEDLEKITLGLRSTSKGSLSKILGALQGRARQNVLFEMGLFIGALGRENVCFLKQKSLRDVPSDISGVLCKYFDKTVEDNFDELRDELYIK